MSISSTLCESPALERGKNKGGGYPYVKPDCRHDKGKADSAYCSAGSGSTYASDDVCCAAWKDLQLPGICSAWPDVERGGAWKFLREQVHICLKLGFCTLNLGSSPSVWALHPTLCVVHLTPPMTSTEPLLELLCADVGKKTHFPVTNFCFAPLGEPSHRVIHQQPMCPLSAALSHH